MARAYIDVYKIIDFDWFDELGEPSCDEDEYAPIDYDEVCFGLYDCGSFFGGEETNLYVDEFTKTYYIESAMREPIGDYGWHTCWRWFKSVDGMYEVIKEAVDKAMAEIKNDNNKSSLEIC